MSNVGSCHDLTVHGFEPRLGLCADSSEPEPASDSVPPSLSVLPLVLLSVESVLDFWDILGAIFRSTLQRVNLFYVLELSVIQISKGILFHHFILIYILNPGNLRSIKQALCL